MKKGKPIPPSFAVWLLHRFLRSDLAEEVEGDLEEKFVATYESHSLTRARLDYWYQVFNYMRPFAFRKTTPLYVNPYSMYKSYCKTAFRNLAKNKLHSFINIAGLSVGMAVTMIIALWVNDERSYEKHFDNYKHIAQVVQNVTNNGELQTWRSVPYPLADELRKNYGSNFSEVVLTAGLYDYVLSSGPTKMPATGIFAEQRFPHLFSLEMVSGSRDALNEMRGILISQSTARTYFGEVDPLGKMMLIDGEMEVTVNGVYKDIPHQSEFVNMQFIASFNLLVEESGWIRNMRDPWRPNAFLLFVQIEDHSTFTQVSEVIRDAKIKKVSTELALKKPELFLHPMSDWHLYGEFENGKKSGGRISYVWLFGVVGGFVLFMACVNFMNLSTARSEKRAREVGIRKAIGSLRSQLISQFFMESIVTVCISFVLAILLVILLLPSFNTIAEKQIALPWQNPEYIVSALVFCLITGLIAGSYPALYLSSVKANSILKGTFKAGRVASFSRKSLVVAQFTVSVVLIIGTLVVFYQINFAKSRPAGYDRSGLIAVRGVTEGLHKHFDAVALELTSGGVITSMAEADAATTEASFSSSSFDWQGKDPDLSVDFQVMGVTQGYGKTINWQIIQGRDFTTALSDSSAFVINEAAAKYLELENPIGATIRWYRRPLTIIGVVEDIIVRSPYEPVAPMFYYITSEPGNVTLARLHPQMDTKTAIQKVETAFMKFGDDRPFTYQFMDDTYATKFNNEERIGKLAGIFTTLAIFISCLGIFGLASFVAEQRTKELGIRKVLGASIPDLWTMLSKEFAILVVIACVIAVPIAWQLITSWLTRFAYRIEVSWWLYAGTCLATLAITLITISWHTLSAARINPVKSLRTE